MNTNEKFEFHKRLLDQFEELILYPTDAEIRFLINRKDFDSKRLSDIREKHHNAMRSFFSLMHLIHNTDISETDFRNKFDNSDDLKNIYEEFSLYDTVCNIVDEYGDGHGFMLDGARENLRTIRSIILDTLPACRTPMNPNSLICRAAANDDPIVLKLLGDYSNAVETIIYSWENSFSKGKYVIYYRMLIDKHDDYDIDDISCRIDAAATTINRAWHVLSKTKLVDVLGKPIEKYADANDLYSVESVGFLKSMFRNPTKIPIANI